jgi:hypothetical protein
MKFRLLDPGDEFVLDGPTVDRSVVYIKVAHGTMIRTETDRPVVAIRRSDGVPITLVEPDEEVTKLR